MHGRWSSGCRKIRSICADREGLIEQVEIFKRCLMSRKNETDKDLNDNPTPARASTPGGYRSVWAYLEMNLWAYLVDGLLP